MSPWSHKNITVHAESGLALVITLILLLVLMAMGAGIAYVASVQSDLVSAVANKPLSIDAAETCFDNALEWVAKSEGQAWVNGLGTALDLAANGQALYGQTALKDTTPLGQTDSRSTKFKDRAGRATYTSCIVEKIGSSTNGNSGNEIGTSNGYGASNFVYTIRITAIGNYNVSMNGSVINKNYWQSNSSKSVLEAVVQYTP